MIHSLTRNIPLGQLNGDLQALSVSTKTSVEWFSQTEISPSSIPSLGEQSQAPLRCFEDKAGLEQCCHSPDVFAYGLLSGVSSWLALPAAKTLPLCADPNC